MKKTIATIAAAIAIPLAGSTAFAAEPAERTNPFLTDYTTPYQIPPFESITYADYMPAVKEGIRQYEADIDAIIRNRATPDFENTILAMEQAGRLLNRVLLVFSSLNETDSSPEMVKLSEEIFPLYSQTVDKVMMNDLLFQRVKQVYDNRAKFNLTPAENRDVEETYKQFVRSGALLSDADKKKLMEMNSQLTDLFLQFNKNLLNDTNAFQLLVTDEAKLSGIPASNIAVAADEAKANGKDGWLFTLHAPSRLPLLQYADNRELREKMYKGYTTLASSGEYNNYPVIAEILKARIRKANILGFKNYADYMTDNVMAKNVKSAEELLMQIWKPAIARVDREVAEMQALSDKEGNNFTIAPWDYYYYAEKVRKDKYNLDEGLVSQYFHVDSVRKGIFSMAKKLYGVTFTEIPDAPKYDPEVKVYDVTDADGKHVAVFMTDYYTRPSKRQGAWMSEFKGSFVTDDGNAERPIVYNVANFTRPTGNTPCLLSLDEVETMFHEFGHGLHGMLTRAKYKSQAGTNVDRDFVELPSQIHEHWAMEPELLKTYAHHYKTGEVIPDELIKKLDEASTHNQGFITTELVGAALLDLQWGQLTDADNVDVESFEKNVADKLSMPSQVAYRYRSPYFKHIFGSDGYASGYYTYLWAEVLDADGFELFKEKGIFDPATAKSFKENVLEAGGSDDPMELYVKFRGKKPTPEALLRNRGLINEPAKPGNLPMPGGK